MTEAEEKYGDIINLPHYEPKNHPRMPMEKRAAQFAPFSALTGYSDAIEEAIRTQSQKFERVEIPYDEI